MWALGSGGPLAVPQVAGHSHAGGEEGRRSDPSFSGPLAAGVTGGRVGEEG